MKIHIPNSAFIGNIDSFLRSYEPSDPDILEISANQKWISVHPVVLSLIAAIALTKKKETIICDKFEAKSRNYFIRMGLFKILGLEEDDIEKHEAAGRFIPLTQIKTSKELDKFITDMIPLLHLQAAPAMTLAYIVEELVRNVIEHASANNGAIICAQYHKKRNTIRIGIADTGLGIKFTINQSHPVTSDLTAIQLALIPGITGTTKNLGGTAQNAGAGLFFIKSIANVNRDFFLIYSGNALYKLLKKPVTHQKLKLNSNPFDDRHSKYNNLPFWQGTIVGIDITLDQTEEFTILLDAIHQAYREYKQEQSKQKYKKPRFI